MTRDPAGTIRELKEQSGKDIWLWGSLPAGAGQTAAHDPATGDGLVARGRAERRLRLDAVRSAHLAGFEAEIAHLVAFMAVVYMAGCVAGLLRYR